MYWAVTAVAPKEERNGREEKEERRGKEEKEVGWRRYPKAKPDRWVGGWVGGLVDGWTDGLVEVGGLGGLGEKEIGG